MTPLEYEYLLKVINYSHVSWWECGSCEGFMLWMSGIIYFFVVFLFRLVDAVVLVYPSSAESMLFGLMVTGGSSFI